jgi:hypothetical protein
VSILRTRFFKTQATPINSGKPEPPIWLYGLSLSVCFHWHKIVAFSYFSKLIPTIPPCLLKLNIILLKSAIHIQENYFICRISRGIYLCIRIVFSKVCYIIITPSKNYSYHYFWTSENWSVSPWVMHTTSKLLTYTFENMFKKRRRKLFELKIQHRNSSFLEI